MAVSLTGKGFKAGETLILASSPGKVGVEPLPHGAETLPSHFHFQGRNKILRELMERK